MSTNLLLEFSGSEYSIPESDSLLFNFSSAPTNVKNILAGDNGNFVAIWADATANIETAKMYVASAGSGAAFSVVNLATQELFDSYTVTNPGIDNETLDGENIVDINVGD
jgi:hypothetical protein